MKIVRVVEHTAHAGQQGLWGHLPMLCADTARANRGEAVYLPLPEHAYSLTPCIYLRLRGVCKAVASGQAGRYIEAIGFALHLCDETLLDELRAAGLPWSSAASFDRAIVAGEGRFNVDDLPGEPGSFTLTVGGVEYTVGDKLTAIALADLVSRFSESFTFNTGDWLLVPLGQPVLMRHLPARVQLARGGHLLLDEHIR